MTSWWGWALRRARASTALLLTLLALVTATTAILAGAVGYSGAAATTAAREALTDAVPEQAGIRVQTRQADDPAAQDAAARARIAEAFDPAPVSVQRTVVTAPRPVSLGGTSLDGSLVALSSEALTADSRDVGERVDVVAGAWPTAQGDPVEGMLHAGAAEDWGVGVGDTLEVGGTEVAVVGLWRPVDAEDASWFGDQLVATGRDDDRRGPLVVAPGVAAQLVDAPFVRWTVQPDATEIQPADLARLASAAGSLRASLKTPEVDVRGVTVDGDLAPTAATASRNLATANALGVIPLSVLVLVTLLSVTQLARLLSTTREAQNQLLVARGATRAQVLLSTVAEAAVVTVGGAALGALVAWTVLRTVPAGESQGGTVVRVAALSGLAVLVVLAAVALLQVWRLTSGGRADLSGRTRAATALATLVLVLGSAAVAWWQLRRTGSPLVVREDGALGTDLVAGAAPALLLAAAAVVAMALLGPLGRAVEAVTRPGRRATGHLAAAQVSRRLPVYAVPAVLTVLAVGATTLAGLYSGTSSVLRDNLTAVGQGAPVRATLDEPPRTVGPGAVPPPPALPGDLDGVLATPVWVDGTAGLGDLTLPLTMAAVDELSQVVRAPDLPGDEQLVPVQALTTGTEPREGVGVPAGTEQLQVALDVDLTVTERDLQGLQEGFEQTVRDVQEGVYGAQVEDEDDARAEARRLTDNLLLQSLGQVDWGVTLLLVDDAGLYHEVDSAPLTVDLPQVLPSWLDLDRLTVPDELPEGTTVDYTEAQVRQGGAEGALTFTFPAAADTAYTLTGVRLSAPRQQERFWGVVTPNVEASLAVRADDGVDLLGGQTSSWGSRELASPEVAERIEADNAELDPDDTVTTVLPDGSRITSTARTPVPGRLDTSGATWTFAARADHLFPERVTVGPGLALDEEALAAHRPTAPSGAEGADAPPVPVALTAQTADAASLGPGDTAELTAFGLALPVRVAAVVPAVPGTLSPRAALLDRDAVAAHYALVGRTLPFPDELWAMPPGGADPVAAAPLVERLAAADGVDQVAGPGRVSVTDATSAARLVFWVASAGAVLLAVTGIGAVAATLLGHRRAEVAVLRALGMPPRAQARSRALELGGVVLASIGLGLLASWLVGRAVVPELARSTTLPGQVALPSALLLEPGPWAVLLGAGALAVLVVVLLQAGRVRAQALDTDYREEIR